MDKVQKYIFNAQNNYQFYLKISPMNVFETFFKLGIHHILNMGAYDHILFLVVLCAIYQLVDFKKLLILITAFTIGHSLTLVLATYGWIKISSDFVEFLIPITILFTSIFNLFQKKRQISNTNHWIRYATALFFGLIHGLAFSNELKTLLFKSLNLAKPLLAFNLGVECGQLVFVIAFMLLTFVLVRIFTAKPRDLNLVLSGAGIGVSLLLIIERYPF